MGGDKSLREQSSRLADGDYTIKLLVNLLARNRSKCHERCIGGPRPQGSLALSVRNNHAAEPRRTLQFTPNLRSFRNIKSR